MTHNPDKRKNIQKGENEIDAAIDNNEPVLPADDSFKTPPRENRLGWEQPMDEQMFGSFDEIREQNGEADEEAD